MSQRRWFFPTAVNEKPKIVAVDISQVPERKRNDPRFLSLLAEMQHGLNDARLVNAICIHEAAHVFFFGHAGYINPTANGPTILYDSARDDFDGHGSYVSFGGVDQQYVQSIDPREWLGRVAKAHAAGGVAARILANSVDRGDGDDREIFNAVFSEVKSSNPAMTWTSDWLWTNAQRAVEADLQNVSIREAILSCAGSLRPDLFCVLDESKLDDTP